MKKMDEFLTQHEFFSEKFMLGSQILYRFFDKEKTVFQIWIPTENFKMKIEYALFPSVRRFDLNQYGPKEFLPYELLSDWKKEIAIATEALYEKNVRLRRLFT